MKLTKIALLAVKGHRDMVRLLSDALGVEQVTIYKYIRNNSDNLTKAAAIDVIKRGTGLTEDQILEADKVKL